MKIRMRQDVLKLLDIKSRNRLRHILASTGANAIDELIQLRGTLGKHQSTALEHVINSTTLFRAAAQTTLFPKDPPFFDRLFSNAPTPLNTILSRIDENVEANYLKVRAVGAALKEIDEHFAAKNFSAGIAAITTTISAYGWSHAALRKLVAIRETLPDADEVVEEFLQRAGLSRGGTVTSSLIHAFSPDQNFLTIRRSVQNIADRGAINRYTRHLARLATHPIAQDIDDFHIFLQEVERCSLIDAIILIKFNHSIVDGLDTSIYPNLSDAFKSFGDKVVFDKILKSYSPINEESEYDFYKQSSAWLEYEAINSYRLTIDTFYDAALDVQISVPSSRRRRIAEWAGEISLQRLIGTKRLTDHPYQSLGALESAGAVTRSTLFNYWLDATEGCVGLAREPLLTLMGMTRDLARTIPISAVRTAAQLSSDPLVKLILLLLLAKRSKNEYDGYRLRKLLESTVIDEHSGSLVNMVQAYYEKHPYVSEYIYDIATEDFLAKLSKLTPHLSDIPDLRASLHEWMAKVTGDEHYTERARAVRIDHQLNRVRNEIDDHRIYVDPSRFSSWIQDEMMIEINRALTSTGSGKKNQVVNSDEAVLSMVVRQCYSAFCSNAVFGIASYIGRRIRHGTFRGHLYSNVINQMQGMVRFGPLFRDQAFLAKWNQWKENYDQQIGELIQEKLHVTSKSKPNGLLQPELYTPFKQEVVDAAVKAIISNYFERKTTEGLDAVITDYCWRLAESDLLGVTKYITSQKLVLRGGVLIDDLAQTYPPGEHRLAADFRRDLIQAIDQRIASISGWFKRPSNVAPRASLSLLYDAVVREVQDSFPGFNPQTEASPHGDIQLVGGVYHIMYDSLAIIVSNAARYGDSKRPVRRTFSVASDPQDSKRMAKKLIVEIASYISPRDNPVAVGQAIEQRKAANFDDANLYEKRSGIPKLMQLASIRPDFAVDFLGVKNNEVVARFSYALEY